jgi:hypothetical protein
MLSQAFWRVSSLEPLTYSCLSWSVVFQSGKFHGEMMLEWLILDGLEGLLNYIYLELT